MERNRILGKVPVLLKIKLKARDCLASKAVLAHTDSVNQARGAVGEGVCVCVRGMGRGGGGGVLIEVISL